MGRQKQEEASKLAESLKTQAELREQQKAERAAYKATMARLEEERAADREKDRIEREKILAEAAANKISQEQFTQMMKNHQTMLQQQKEEYARQRAEAKKSAEKEHQRIEKLLQDRKSDALALEQEMKRRDD